MSLDLAVLLPALVPLGGALLVLVADLVVPTLRRLPWAIAALASIGTAVATVPGLASGDTRSTLCLATPSGSALPTVEGLPASCFWEADALTGALQLVAGVAALVCVTLAWPRPRGRVHGPTSEPVQVVLLLAALAATVVVAASRDVGTWLVALELATLPVVVLVALSGRRSALAGATQLLVMSLVSFALLTLGVALWYAATGSPFLTPDAALSTSGAFEAATGAPTSVVFPSVSAGVVSLATVLVLAGVGFKLSLVPFHAWTPTAYAGAPLPIATFLATVSKIAALAALLVVLRAVSVLGTPALLSIALLAALSMTVGNVLALRQDDVVRLLAWSTVAQAGWVVLPLVSISALGVGASATYLLTYVLATLVAFAVVAVTVRERPADGRTLAGYEGLWRRSPWRAGALALALTSLAGLPPGIIGLVGKVVALRPVVAEGWVWLAAIAAANAVLGVAVYLRWLRPVVSSPDAPGAVPGVPRRRGGRVAVAGLVLAAAVLVVVSVQPDVLLRLLG
ncbi:proton-conducting transporter membrane subunit [Intrasporangium flavum]|uniref:proton-conducting transporter transmembrane domain-containing protein n=1 Tax=Intrasporangium flavum TaxID=1428657 RepID=UPI00096F2B78|nr:proton-conducting transporter membrane subunit [Intrasporangium flavum]